MNIKVGNMIYLERKKENRHFAMFSVQYASTEPILASIDDLRGQAPGPSSSNAHGSCSFS